MNNKIAIGADHGGFARKEDLKKVLLEKGYEVEDFGVNSTASMDYPDIAHPLATAVANGEYPRGILLCGTGLGVSCSANRHKGIRATLCWSKEVAALAREHNNSNILVLSGRHATIDPLEEIMLTWLTEPYPGEERHQRRIDKIELN